MRLYCFEISFGQQTRGGCIYNKVFIRAHNRVLASLLFRSGGHNMFGHIPEEV